jgi:RHS repeat-associated protein
LSNVVYHAYDHVGREIRTWGTGTYPVEYAFDAYGAKTAMRTFRYALPAFGTSPWPLSDDGSDPQNPNPSSWTSGDKTSWSYDAGSGLLASKTDAAGHAVTYAYTSAGKLYTRAWSRGVTTTYSYDANTGEQTGIAYSDSTPGVTYTFDRLGHGSTVVQTYSGYSLTTALQYTVPGKLSQETFDSAYFGGRQLSYQFDTTTAGALGRTTGFELGTSGSPAEDQGITFGFDTYGRFSSEAVASGPAFTYGYASNSNLLSGITDSADSWSQSRSWETHRDLLTQIQTTVGSTSEGTFAYLYDALGRRTSRVETGAIFARYEASGLTDLFSYDSLSQVTEDQAYQSTNPTSPTTPMLGRDFKFLYDTIGNRVTSSVDSQPAVSYTSNSLNQIASRTVPGYYEASGFSPNGSTITVNGSALTSGQIQNDFFTDFVSASNSSAPQWATASVSSSYGGSTSSNAFVPQTPEAYAYDLDGNILSDGRWNYTWDAENRLLSVETYGHKTGQSTAVWTSGVPQIHVDYAYDYQGRRIAKKLSTWSGSAFAATSETRFAYENWNVVADYSFSAGTLAFYHGYAWGMDISGKRHGAGGVGGLLAMITASGAAEIPIYDANGNVQGLTDRTSQQLTASYEYSPFGEILRESGSYALINPFRFSTRYADDESHMIYYGHRYYNPALGRFLGRDQIQEKGGLNLYAFCQNNGVNSWDELGDMWAWLAKVCNWLGFDVDTPKDDNTPNAVSGPASNSPNPNEQYGPATKMDKYVVNDTKTISATAAGAVTATLPPSLAVGGDVVGGLTIVDALPFLPFLALGGDRAPNAKAPPTADANPKPQANPPSNATKSTQSKPTNAPPGTVPIDQGGLSSGDIHDIKDGIGAGATDWTGIAPNGDIITTGPDGKMINHGPADSYIPGGGSGGSGGKGNGGGSDGDEGGGDDGGSGGG